MTASSYEASVAAASVIPPAEPTTLPRAIRAIDAPPPQPIEWLIADLWPSREFGLLVGDGGAFKSTVALHLAGAVAAGARVFNRYQTAQGPALVVSAEDSQDVVMMRLEALVRGHGWPRRQTLSEIHVLCSDDPSLGSARWRMHLSAEVERVRPAFIVLDPWAELLGGDENSNTDARPAIKFVRSLARSVGAAVAAVHHAGKAGADRRPLDRIRGASALPSAARVIWFFDYQDDGVHVECLKLSRAPRTAPFVVRRQIEHALGNRAQWLSARLEVEDAKAFTASRAEQFVIEQLQLAPNGRRTSAELRELVGAVGRGVNRFDLTHALTALQARGVISYDPGAQGRKFWFLTPSASRPGPGDGRGNSAIATANGTVRAGNLDGSGDVRDPTGEPTGTNPTDPTQTLPGRVGQTLHGPFRGPVGSETPAPSGGRVDGPVGSVGSRDDDDLIAEIDERLGRVEADS